MDETASHQPTSGFLDDDVGVLLPLLNPDLMRAVVEASECPTTAYIQLLGLSHGIREAIRGTAREIAFENPMFPDLVTVPSVPLEALTALLGPCKHLTRLTLVAQEIPLLNWGTEAECIAWVEETFAGHTPLAVLRVPVGPLLLALLHTGRLASLGELHIERGGDLIRAELLSGVGRSCPGLKSLQLLASFPADVDPTDALRPLATNLEHLSLASFPTPSSLPDLLGDCPHLTRLRVPQSIPVTTLGTLAPRLTHLTLGEAVAQDDLAGLLLPRLESLDLSKYGHPLGWLPQAAPCLRHLRLNIWNVPEPTAREILTCAPLLDRLVSLDLGAAAAPLTKPLHLACPNLQTLRLYVHFGHASGLSLACPALHSLELPGGDSPYALDLGDTPRLRRVVAPWLFKPLPPMMGWIAGALLPRACGPASCLHELLDLWIDGPETLAALEKFTPSLTRLSISLAMSRLPNAPLVLRLPPRLARLDIPLVRWEGTAGGEADLHVEAGPSLRTFALGSRGLPRLNERIRLRLQCPGLVSLSLNRPAVLSLTLADNPPLQCLRLAECSGLGPACLLACLTQHGSHLRYLSLDDLWPQHVGALGQLPVLSSLVLSGTTWHAQDVALACPRLARLVVLADRVGRLELTCPALSEFRLWCEEVGALEFVGPSSTALRRILTRHENWRDRLAERFPGVQVEQRYA
ncbi:hypothetical protein PAPYR_2519 [Paratrimastix pyriformis]|uniref:Uncharacterized protein n=1 Tax=Paratrimastix pyriformis TaxID=342808 RepID=A0ABQ8UUM9_9EUKA|nr:hypothetical protein PAPYR_2519 [Paratrimastix pyriformis]